MGGYKILLFNFNGRLDLLLPFTFFPNVSHLSMAHFSGIVGLYKGLNDSFKSFTLVSRRGSFFSTIKNLISPEKVCLEVKEIRLNCLSERVSNKGDLRSR